MQHNSTSTLSEEETKQYLTPFAFKIDHSLFGLPLASPTKRGIALLIDLMLIALLSDVSGVVLALAIAVTLYYLSKNKGNGANKVKGRKRKAIMRFISALVLFVILLDMLPPLLKSVENIEPQVSAEESSLSLTQSLTIGAVTLSTIQKINNSRCKEMTCWQTELNSIAANIATASYENNITISLAQRDEIFNDIGQEIELPASEQQQLILFMNDSYNKQMTLLKNEEVEYSQNKARSEPIILQQSIKPISEMEDDLSILDDDENFTDIDRPEENNKQVYSLIKWAKGVINDLGLGFGWATFYFTVFIAMGKGQTLGKKLLSIKVIQLDGTPLSFWDSFGRYGGYGAGLATGLLGFIQIYWDPNKQAIHDKISSTVVIDIKKTRLNDNVNLTSNS